MRVQIYTMQSVAETEAVTALGVDHVGVTPADHGLPGEIDAALAAEICRAAKGRATSVALSIDTDLAVVVDMVRTVQPDILHLCGPEGEVKPSDVAALRDELVDVELMQAIAVTGSHAVEVARRYEPFVDYLILDSVSPDVPGVGAAGTTHDWAVSAAIVAAVKVPVVLAGGLSPSNVADAIAEVQPWGVDSLTYTNRRSTTGSFGKDLDAVREFVSAAHGRRPV
jgi:phosphoribosylanthranilate isomerase